MENIYLTALALSTIAGLSTVLGSFIMFFIRRESMRTLSLGLGFSAGVMIFVSLVELLPKASLSVIEAFGPQKNWITLVCFAAGILIAVLIDYFTPDHIEDAAFVKQVNDNMHIDSPLSDKQTKNNLKKAGLVTALAVTIHNFPEGLTTFFATTTSLKLGLTVVFAIAIHNIPEGIAISLPVYQATGSKRKAFYYTFLSGMAEPLGGVIGFLLIKFLFPEMTIGIMFALIAGIMTYISFDTLLPLSREYDTGHYSITGVVLGMLTVGLGIMLF